ncbi:hypothetical protein [Geodermatophilus sp. SYSU D00766]
MLPDRCDTVDTVVLLEGRSDVAAVRTVAAALGLLESAHRYRLVDMGGVTNVHRHLVASRARPVPVRVVGMCDAGEADVVVRALGLDGPRQLPGHGFSVCDADLEDELIRACGPDRVLDVLERVGLRGRFAAFCNQLTWRGRPVEHQLHRFAGIASGRKALLAAALAAALEPEQVPAPLCRLLERIVEAPDTERVRPPT